MANGHGGSRVPSNPAPVSGPGALSQRTDGQAARYMSGGQYGEGQEMMELQTSAPMSKSQAASPRPRSGGRPAVAPQQSVTPLFAPTERPDEPITAGAPFGPGPGPAPQRMIEGRVSSRLLAMAAYDESGDLGFMADILVSRGL